MDDDFKERVKKLLAHRAGHVCSNPACSQPTSGPSDSPKSISNVGEGAHISGARPGSARYDPAMTSEARGAFENGIWLCSKCAKMIDDDAVRYTVALLQDWKKAREQSARVSVEGGGQPTIVRRPQRRGSKSNGISVEAVELLCAGARDPQGAIFAIEMLHGFDVTVGGRNFVEPRSPRTEARWRAVVQELVDGCFIEPRGANGDWYALTDEGYRLTEALGGRIN